MRNISDTIARLAALQAKQTAYAADTQAPDHLETLPGFGSNPGALKARSYLPDELAEGAPLVVVLHGCTQNAAAYDHHSGWSSLADEAGFALLFPEQQRGNNPSLCFNWFLPGDTRRDFGEAISIRQMIETMVTTHGLDRKRIFITGLSAGGAMTAAMLASYPEVFAGGAIVAGLPYGSATTVPEAFDRMRGHGGPSEKELQRALRDASDHQGPWPKISIWHGTADHTVAHSNAQDIASQWRGIQGLNKAPTRSETVGARTRHVWHGATHETRVELNMIAGMGHGTPVGDGLGTPGPFMLDVGISSTREIAHFWGIAATDKRISTPSRQPAHTSQRHLPPARIPEMATANVAPPEPAAAYPFARNRGLDAPGVKKTIEDALRAAGLMR